MTCSDFCDDSNPVFAMSFLFRKAFRVRVDKNQNSPHLQVAEYLRYVVRVAYIWFGDRCLAHIASKRNVQKTTVNELICSHRNHGVDRVVGRVAGGVSHRISGISSPIVSARIVCSVAISVRSHAYGVKHQSWRRAVLRTLAPLCSQKFFPRYSRGFAPVCLPEQRRVLLRR